MARASVGAIRIIDQSGDPCDADDGTLKVSLQAGAAINIGDVEVLGHSSITSYKNNAISDTTAEIINGGSIAGGSGSANSSIPCKHIDITCPASNTGIIYIGGAGVAADTGIALSAGDVYSIDIDDANKVYALAGVDDEAIIFIVYN